MTCKACVPIEPVEPRIAICFFFLLVSIFILSISSYFVDKHIIADYHLYLITRHISSFIIDNLKNNVFFRIYRVTFIPKFEVQVRPCTKCSAISYQGDGFASFHPFTFLFQERAAVFVDRN